jgi:glycosyltransferase involved in cell wall biosynthesis
LNNSESSQSHPFRVLQLIKTNDGARWALDQVMELVKAGFDVHVVLPEKDGRFSKDWRNSGAVVHKLDIGLFVTSPVRFMRMLSSLKALVAEISPDIIHSHFFSTTLAIRYALGRKHSIPRIFQVPGPFHMEYAFFRALDLSAAGLRDYWIASSRYTYLKYLSNGISTDRLFVSYYGNKDFSPPQGRLGLREKYGIARDAFVVGNVNYMYPPRWYLGQTKGIKRHEDVIDALAIVMEQKENVVGLIIGGEWGSQDKYEKRLVNRAAEKSSRIIMTGWIPAKEAKLSWNEFDLAIHVPSTENCGGVIEPLIAGVPVIASSVGGLPEVIFDGVTGSIVDHDNPQQLAAAILEVISNINKYKEFAGKGRCLVQEMFDVKRTSNEVVQIYRHILDSGSFTKPDEFDSFKFALQH